MTLGEEMCLYMQEKQMTAPEDGVLVGFSGGPDSLALLLLLCAEKERLGLSFVAACHVHHGIRGAEAEKDAEFCRRFCAENNILFSLRRVDVPAYGAENGLSHETAGRILRYDCLTEEADRLAKESGRRVRIATAHHSRDQAETVFFHLIRGSGLAGLGGIPPVRGQIIRPLLFCDPKRLLALLEEKKQPYCIDQTNAETCYRRNYIRQTILPAALHCNPAFLERLNAHTAAFRADEDYLSSQAEKAFSACKTDEGFSAARFCALPEPLARRTAALLLRENGVKAELRDIAALSAVLFGRRRAFSPKPELRFILLRGLLKAERTDRPAPAYPTVVPVNFPLVLPAACGLPALTVTISDVIHKNIIENSKKPLFLAVDYDTIKGKSVVRSPAENDRFCPMGMSGQKQLSVLLQEAGLTRTEQAGVLVLADEDGVLAVLSKKVKRTAARAAVTAQTGRILVLCPAKDAAALS